ncbi:MAG TPA: hypothetical protein VFR87_04320 [Nocardioidaceae bacterium]|nr:hypothetical protein [Nocardioidaceae bacterium]
MDAWRAKAVVNAANGSTLLGLGVAVLGRARFSRGPRGLVLATGYRFALPRASAFTVGNVVVTKHDERWWQRHPRMLLHEERHSWQYVVTLGLPMLPLYGVAAAWSCLRGGDLSTHNVFETAAGLEDGGYPLVSRRQRLRLQRTA